MHEVVDIKLNDIIKDFLDYCKFPENVLLVVENLAKKMDSDIKFKSEMKSIVESYNSSEYQSMLDSVEKIKALSKETGISEFTLNFWFVLLYLPVLKERYCKNNIPDKVFYDSMLDIKYKVYESIECKNIVGIFVPTWYFGFFELTRFAYGRFQYEATVYNENDDFELMCGKTVKKGQTLINLHVPSSGVSLTDDVRIASYKEAYDNFKYLFPDEIVLFCCASWLLYPRHNEFLHKNSNILNFLRDFEIVRSRETEEFNDKWRIFGKYCNLPYDKLPRDNSLRQAYADWMLAGNKTGSGFGIMAFDGKKVLK